ncbi:hypothetical protein OAN24_06260, partial [Pseudodesulfovibrio sp.]|nr:hypothetical protein [Pseudodesulfovibrio sp.]
MSLNKNILNDSSLIVSPQKTGRISYDVSKVGVVNMTAFSFAEGDCFIDDSNLVVQVADNSEVVLAGYFDQVKQGAVPLIVTDDSEVYVTEDLEFEDFETEAGAQTGGSGLGEYLDDAGALYAGLTALGGQGDPLKPSGLEEVVHETDLGYNSGSGGPGGGPVVPSFTAPNPTLIVTYGDDDFVYISNNVGTSLASEQGLVVQLFANGALYQDDIPVAADGAWTYAGTLNVGRNDIYAVAVNKITGVSNDPSDTLIVYFGTASGDDGSV